MAAAASWKDDDEWELVDDDRNLARPFLEIFFFAGSAIVTMLRNLEWFNAGINSVKTHRGHLHTYRFCDNVWTFILQDAVFKSDECQFDEKNADPMVNMDQKKDEESAYGSLGGLYLCPSSAPGLILLELKHAKVNLIRSTNDLVDIRATVESYNRKIEKERISLEKTGHRLSSSSLKVLSLEQELNQTKDKLLVVKCAGGDSVVSNEDPVDISRQLQSLSSETEKFKQVAQVARLEVLRESTGEVYRDNDSIVLHPRQTLDVFPRKKQTYILFGTLIGH